MRILLTVVTAIGMLGMIAGAVLAQSGNELFSQALSKERTEGKMAEAIKLYQAIVQKYSSDRTLVAKALVQMGLSYKKLGNVTDARRAFDRVLREYKDQKAAADAAAHLAELDRARVAPPGGGYIKGSVTDSGQPVGNAQVFALQAVNHDGQSLMKQMFSARTDNLGDFTLGYLRPGKYYIVAEIPDRVTGIGAVDNRMHVPIYHPGTPDWHKATVVGVGPPAGSPAGSFSILGGLKIDASSLPVWRVRGTVTGVTAVANAAGRPTVTMMARDLPFPRMNLPEALTFEVDPSGAFEFPRVPPGSYVLYASQIGGSGGHVDIEVQDRDVSGVNIAMTPGLTVSGRLEASEPFFRPRVVLRLDPPVRGSTVYAANPMSDGSFMIGVGQPLQKGNYRVSVDSTLDPPTAPQDRPPSPSGGHHFYVKSIRLGTADVLNDGLHLNEQPQQELVIVIGTNSATLEGRVVNDRREPVAASAVVLIPEGGIRFRVIHQFTATDAAGRFRLERIPPGSYKVFAWQDAKNGEWQDSDFVRSYESRGKVIHIKEGDRQTKVEVVGIPPKL